MRGTSSTLDKLVIIAKQKRLPEGGIGCSKFLRTLLIYECENLQKMLSLLFHFFQKITTFRMMFELRMGGEGASYLSLIIQQSSRKLLYLYIALPI